MADNFSELDDCISDVLKKFQLVSGLQFKLRQEQVIAVTVKPSQAYPPRID